MVILLLIIGLTLILVGANILTDGASALAKRFNISEFVIGLTVVAIGTSTPELVVSIMSAIQGSSDIAVGNVIGSNIFNTLFIIAVTALVAPLALTSGNMRKDIPFGVLASAVLLFAASDIAFNGASVDSISRTDGILMLCFFAIFMAYSIFSAKSAPSDPSNNTEHKKLWLTCLMIVGGLVGLVFGGNMFLESATSIARSFGIKDSVIAITLMAGGTSLPELAASVVSAVKRKPEIALGNVIGSNIANIFLVLGASATITPLTLGDILPADIMVMLVSSVLLLITAFTFRRHKIDRWEGVLFLAMYVGYIWWLIGR